MRLNPKIFKILLGLCFLFIINTNAQIQKKAQVGFRFLTNPVSAEVMGRGGVGVVATYNSNGIFWNPALIGLIKKSVDISLNHTKDIADINYNAVAAAVRLGNFGVIGFSLLAMDYGTFYQTVRANNAQGYIETGTFSPTAVEFGMGFSQKVTDRFSYGVQIKYVRQNLGKAWIAVSGDSLNDPNFRRKLQKYVQSTIAFDVGTFYDFHYKGIKFAATIQNISRELKYENQKFPLPFAISFGATVDPLSFFIDGQTGKAIVLSFESRHPRDYGGRMKFGAEYHFLDSFTVRAGYMLNYDERNFTAGFGVKQEVSGMYLRVNYAFQPYGIFGNVQFISIGISY